MTFLSVLLALFVERMLPQYRPRRLHGWFTGYCRHLTAVGFTHWLISRPWGVAAVLLPPLLLIAWLQAFFAGLGTLLPVVFGIAVLSYSLGPRELSEEVEAYLAARDAGLDERADELAQALSLFDAPRTEPRRSLAVAHAVVVLAARRLVAPIFWFVILGPVGAAAYRCIVLLTEHLQSGKCPGEMQQYGEELRRVAEWAPARMTAAGYAIAGNFDAVAHAWRTHVDTAGGTHLTEAEHLLANTGLAALDTFPDDADALDDAAAGLPDTTPPPPVVEDALALVWRSLAVWMAVIAGGSLVAALA